MQLNHLRSFAAVCDAEFSVSRAAESLHLVQPAVSQHLKQLEEELGTRLFVRRGKRLAGLTEAGEQARQHARRVLAEMASLRDLGADMRADGGGRLRIGATHTQARYVLPAAIRRLRREHPDLDVEIQQGRPEQLVEWALDDRLDLAICTESLAEHTGLITIPCNRWQRCLIAPLDHPILAARPISLELLCEHPLVTYVHGFTGRGRFNNSFARDGLKPRIVLSAADSDVIKCYVREGLGVGIIADLALEPGVDDDLGRRSLGHLFPAEVTRIAYPKGKYLRRAHQAFVEIFQQEAARRAPRW